MTYCYPERVPALFRTTVKPVGLAEACAVAFVDLRVPVFWDGNSPVVFATSVRVFIQPNGELWAWNDDDLVAFQFCFHRTVDADVGQPTSTESASERSQGGSLL